MLSLSNILLGGFALAGASSYTRDKYRPPPLGEKRAGESAPGFDKIGMAWQSKYTRRFDASGIAIAAAKAKPKVDKAFRYIDTEIAPMRPSTIRDIALMRKSNRTDITENPYTHRTLANAGSSLFDSVAPARFAYHDSTLLQRKIESAGNFNISTGVPTSAIPAVYGRKGEGWWEMRR